MKVISIIPVKDLDHTKTRLSPLLDLKMRQDLTRSILYRTIQVIKCTGKVHVILVITPDYRVFSFAKKQGVIALLEQEVGLNNALQQATEWCKQKAFDALLIIPSDIPFLQAKDIDSIIDMGKDEKAVIIISPDNKQDGTNALLIKPPGILNYFYGSGSYDIHCKQARNAQYKLMVYFSRSIGFDIDYPEQYEILCKTIKIR